MRNDWPVIMYPHALACRMLNMEDGQHEQEKLQFIESLHLPEGVEVIWKPAPPRDEEDFLQVILAYAVNKHASKRSANSPHGAAVLSAYAGLSSGAAILLGLLSAGALKSVQDINSMEVTQCW